MSGGWIPEPEERLFAIDSRLILDSLSISRWIRYNFPILWYLLLLSREIDTRRGEGDQES